MEKLKVGDVVRLRSGGPWMTVVEFVQGTENVLCLWFKTSTGFEEGEPEYGERAQQGVFPVVTLEVKDAGS